MENRTGTRKVIGIRKAEEKGENPKVAKRGEKEKGNGVKVGRDPCLWIAIAWSMEVKMDGGVATSGVPR